MFTGIVTDVGEVIAVEPRAEGLKRACGSPAATIRTRSRSAPRLPAAGCASPWWRAAGTAIATGSRSMPPPRRCGSPRVGRWRAGHEDQSRALAQGRRRTRRPHRRRSRRRPGGADRARRSDRDGAAHLPGAGCARPVHRAEGLGGARRRLADRQRRSRATTFSVLIIPHTLGGDDHRRARGRRRVNLEVDLMARYAARLLEQSELRGGLFGHRAPFFAGRFIDLARRVGIDRRDREPDDQVRPARKRGGGHEASDDDGDIGETHRYAPTGTRHG